MALGVAGIGKIPDGRPTPISVVHKEKGPCHCLLKRDTPLLPHSLDSVTATASMQREKETIVVGKSSRNVTNLERGRMTLEKRDKREGRCLF